MRRAAGFQFLRFSAVGLLNTAIHYAVFIALLRLLHANYLAASVVGYCCGLLNSYLLNRRWTFKALDPASQKEFARFIVVNVAALTLNSAVLFVCVSGLGFRPELVQLPTLGATMAVNFLGNRLWTFKRPALAA